MTNRTAVRMMDRLKSFFNEWYDDNKERLSICGNIDKMWVAWKAAIESVPTVKVALHNLGENNGEFYGVFSSREAAIDHLNRNYPKEAPWKLSKNTTLWNKDNTNYYCVEDIASNGKARLVIDFNA